MKIIRDPIEEKHVFAVQMTTAFDATVAIKSFGVVWKILDQLGALLGWNYSF